MEAPSIYDDCLDAFETKTPMWFYENGSSQKPIKARLVSEPFEEENGALYITCYVRKKKVDVPCFLLSRNPDLWRWKWK